MGLMPVSKNFQLKENINSLKTRCKEKFFILVVDFITRKPFVIREKFATAE